MDYFNFGKNLKSLRINQKLTQDEFSAKLGLTRQSISKWERGQCYPSIDVLELITEVLNCSIEQLLLIEKKGK